MFRPLLLERREYFQRTVGPDLPAVNQTTKTGTRHELGIMGNRFTAGTLKTNGSRIVRFVVSIVFGLCCLGTVTAQSVVDGPAARSVGVKRALLIGINKYKAVPGLQGSVNDVETMREILTKRWGFLPSNITTLTDEGATRARILAAITEIVGVSAPEDTLYIHYSGHGSQVQDLNGDEDDGLDETLVPQDGRTSGVRDIVDDELDAIFSNLRTRNAVIVLDSCHSGTATRSFGIRARSVPQDMRIDLYKTGVTGAAKRGIKPLKDSRFIAIGAAADDEEALDGPIEGTFHGFFTYSLARALAAADRNATPRQILAEVVQELARIQAAIGRISMPEPQMEGPNEAFDRPLFALSPSAAAASSTPVSPRVAWLDAEPSAGDQITLINGSALGAVPGSTWAVYPPGEILFAAGEALAVATVVERTGKDSRGNLSAGSRSIEPGSRAIALLPAPSSMRVAIHMLEVPSSARSRIEAVLNRHIAGIAWVKADQPARFLMDMRGETVRLLAADGLKMLGSFRIDDEKAAIRVARIASRSTRAIELLTLDNPSSRVKVNVHVAARQPIASRDIQLVAHAAPAQLHVRRQTEPRSAENSLQLDIDVNTDSYITIVDVDSEGSMNVLFPNPYQHGDFYADGAVRATEHVLIPDSLQNGNRAGFYWDYSPPSGIDTVRVFASTDLATATAIRQRIDALQKQTRGADADLLALRDDLDRSAVRGIKLVADKSPGDTGFSAPIRPADWSATSVTIQLAE